MSSLADKKRARDWYNTHKEDVRVRENRTDYQHQYYILNKARINIRTKKYRLTHLSQNKKTSFLYRLEHRNELEIYRKAWAHKIKEDVLLHYGNGKCACVICGFDDIKALSIDHIDGGGGKHRKSLGGKSFYVWLKTKCYPLGFQTLCMNCQWIKRTDNKEATGGKKRE